ncbi:MAG: tetratricopeptide repeat protein [Anaerolineae bacterium]|nr:tetratricopeptide repeat protein [Anaerolineae bacterium]
MEFRTKIQEYRRAAGIPQKQLARELGLNPTVLSHKLNNSDDMRLTHQEVKRIVLLLAQWQAIGSRAEAEQLLQLMQLKPTAFTEQEWQSPPLVALDAGSPIATAEIPSAAVTTPSQMGSPPATSGHLLGRDDLVSTLQQRLNDPTVRLVTLTGSGGVGKTRLAIELAQHMSATYQDGVVFVPLASINDPLLVASEILHALKLKGDSQQTPDDQLKQYLAERRMLLILDNFEHVMGAAPMVSALIGAAPRLCILVTSRTVLNLYGEYQVRVPPLALPQPQQTLTTLAEQPSVALFVARTQAVRSDFALTEANANAVAEICIRLDGLPLALELAAARCRLFSPKALLQRLDQPLALLSSTSSDVSARQRTLRDTIAWSYHLLHDMEQRLFTFVSLFPGGCTADAAEMIYQDQPPIGLDTALEVVSSLLDKSLLYQQEGQDHQVRFLMLETLREYAIEQITDSGAIDGLRELQLQYYRQVVHEVAPQLSGEKQQETIDLLEAEHDSLRAILAWALIYRPMEALKLCGDAWYFWFVRGYYTEGYRWMSQALQAPLTDEATEEDQAEYAKALHGMGSILYSLGNYEQAAQHLESALAIRRRLNDSVGIMSTLNNLGNVAWDRSQLDQAQAYYEEVIALGQQTGNKRMVANASNNLGSLLWQRDDLEDAQRHLQRALAVWRELQNKLGLSQVLSNLGIIAVKQSQFDRASVLYAESLALARELGDRQSISASLNNIGEVALHKGDYAQAQRYFEEALALKREVNYAWGISTSLRNVGLALLFQHEMGRAIVALQEGMTIMRELGDRHMMASNLEALGVASTRLGDVDGALAYHHEALTLSIALEEQQGCALSLACIAATVAVRGDWSTAIRWWGAAFAQWEHLNTPLLPAEYKRFSDELESVRAQVPAAEFEARWQEGHAMEFEVVIQEALTVTNA